VVARRCGCVPRLSFIQRCRHGRGQRRNVTSGRKPAPAPAPSRIRHAPTQDHVRPPGDDARQRHPWPACQRLLGIVQELAEVGRCAIYTNTSVYNVVPGKYYQMDRIPRETAPSRASSAASSTPIKIYRAASNPPDVSRSRRWFLQSHGRLISPSDLRKKGVVLATEMGNATHTSDSNS
ncbi:hypothetical protein ACHAWF_001699, partial [Thalassiosira exigua]